MDNLLEKAINNLVIAALVPALAFTLIIELLLLPLLSPDFVAKLNNLAWQPALITLALTIIFGFTILHLKHIVVNFYRGIYFPKSKLFCFLETNRAKRLRDEKEKTEREMSDVYQKILKASNNKQSKLVSIYQQLRSRFYEINALCNETLPPSSEPVSSMKLGNILRAAEFYPAQRYGIDPVIIWPRLVQIVPEQEYAKFEKIENQMYFLLNSASFTLTSSIVCLLLSAYQYILYSLSINNRDPFFSFISTFEPRDHWQNFILYSILAIFFFVANIFFYKAATPLSTSYAHAFRSTFDLYRFKLLDYFKVELPSDSDQEHDTWVKISEWLRHGQELGEIRFDYYYQSEKH